MVKIIIFKIVEDQKKRKISIMVKELGTKIVIQTTKKYTIHLATLDQ